MKAVFQRVKLTNGQLVPQTHTEQLVNCSLIKNQAAKSKELGNTQRSSHIPARRKEKHDSGSHFPGACACRYPQMFCH